MIYRSNKVAVRLIARNLHRREVARPKVWLVGKKVDIDDLVGAAEIAERLGVKRPHLIHDWRRRHSDFPQPVLELKGTLIWLWPEVERWARASGRL